MIWRRAAVMPSFCCFFFFYSEKTAHDHYSVNITYNIPTGYGDFQKNLISNLEVKLKKIELEEKKNTLLVQLFMNESDHSKLILQQ